MLARPYCAVLLALVMFWPSPSVQARPAHKRALADYFGPYLAKPLNDCRTCHMPEQPSANDGDGKPHNPFGARLKAVKSELRRAGKPTTITDRLEAIANEDSDGDGVPNLIELLSGHNPGDDRDRPTPTEIERAQNQLAAFRKLHSGYPWKPFEVVQRPSIPMVKHPEWVRNPVDAFIAQEHDQRGLTPRPEAPKAVLLRRLYLDLVGLPPTPEELHAFLADSSSDAYEGVVDTLLASPAYGERWGRHWMDIWRYSDWAGWSDGKQIRDSQPHIWRWRDWIVESLNKDKGYDRMIMEMLAADELCPEDTDALRATGYLVRNYKMLSREKWMQDTVDHTAMAFLGVSLGCARCHDHMYDPILQKEYYQVRAIFEPHNVRIDRVPGEPDTTKDGLVHVFDANIQVPTFLFIRGDDRTPDKKPLSPGVPEFLGGRFTPEAVNLPRDAVTPDRRDFVEREDIDAGAVKVENLHKAAATRSRAASLALASGLGGTSLHKVVAAWRTRLAENASALAHMDWELAEAEQSAFRFIVRAENLADRGQRGSKDWTTAAQAAVEAQRRSAVIRARRDLFLAQYGAPKPAKAAKVKSVPEAEKELRAAEARLKDPPAVAYAEPTRQTYPSTSTGRRLALARWIASRENPLAARVAMNHLWLRHFGQAIVPTVSDFGRNGRPATHPALLDWLAAEFMDRGWSMKAMHRLMVTSSTYRMASTSDPVNLERDQDNVYLWRMPSRRVEAEVVRDCIFYVAGQLDQRMGGPDIDYTLGLSVPRRSLYFRHAAEKEMEFLKIFDCAGVTECYQRKESIMPQQALALTNSELTLTRARQLARRLTPAAGPNPQSFVIRAFEQVLSRSPTRDEVTECVRFLEAQTRKYQHAGSVVSRKADQRAPAVDPAARARENLVHVLLNHHEFVTVR